MNATPNDVTDLPVDVMKDWKWATKHEAPALKEAIAQMFLKCSTISQDYQGTDWVYEGAEKTNIACRIRRLESAKRYRDFTLRSARSSGAKTELAKIRDGVGNLYLYGWVDDEELQEYVVISLDVFRKCGLAYVDRTSKMNKDRKTWFVAYTLEELWECGCIVCGQKYPGKPVSFVWTRNTNPKCIPRFAKS